ncbi:MAG: epoxyqueuosine reductase QueH, partial [Candidatus Coproplasma sp.]
CERCFSLRLERTAKEAQRLGFDYFATTLTVSPLKDEQLINSIGYALEGRYSVKWLPSDFKKRNGYLRSIELSEEYSLYRQNYCGCIYSAPKA